jgi:hypothetical protein
MIGGAPPRPQHDAGGGGDECEWIRGGGCGGDIEERREVKRKNEKKIGGK